MKLFFQFWEMIRNGIGGAGKPLGCWLYEVLRQKLVMNYDFLFEFGESIN